MLIKEFQSGWERLVLYAGEEVFKILQTYTTSLIHTQFGKYGHLKPHVRCVLDRDSSYNLANYG